MITRVLTFIPVGLDYELLLSIQYVCNKKGIAIPWNEVGQVMSGGDQWVPFPGTKLVR